MPDPIIDPQKDPGGKGDQDVKGGDPAKEPEKAPGVADDSPKYITPNLLQGIMNAEKRLTTEQFKKQADQTAGLQALIETLTKSLAEKDAATSAKGDDKGGKSKPPESAEMIELRRTVDELKETNKASDARAADERQKRFDTEFKNTVIAALTAAGCEKPEEAFLVIRPRLTHEPEEDKIFASVKSDYGSEDLDLKTYIERYFREDVLPHVFKGKMRTGAPASGDDGGSGSFQFTKEQVFDPEAYMKDPDKHREAIEKGRVRGLDKKAGV